MMRELCTIELRDEYGHLVHIEDLGEIDEKRQLEIIELMKTIKGGVQ